MGGYNSDITSRIFVNLQIMHRVIQGENTCRKGKK